MSSKKREEADEPKIGVYVCHCGGNISDHVDVKQVAENVKDIPNVVISQTNMFMCSDPGQELIQEDIKTGKINRVVVASCAPSLHELTFRNAIKRADMNPYLYEHANIREQDSWVHDGDPATTKATTLIKAAIAKVKNLEALEPIRVDACNHATVIGGGMAGLRAAIDLSQRGIKVALVEKSPFLGGQAANLQKLFPTGETAFNLIQKLAETVVNDPDITVYTCSRIVNYEGYVGNFKIIVKRQPPDSKIDLDKLKKHAGGGGVGSYTPFAGFYPDEVPTAVDELMIDTGVIIFATGFELYVPRENEFGYRSDSEVITLPQLIRFMAAEKFSGRKLTIKGRRIRRVAMIHCVGSRQIPGIHEPSPISGDLNEYCSRTCCTATLQAAIEIREKFPETHVLEYYRDIRTYGRGQEEYYEKAGEKKVLFFRYEPESAPVVEHLSSGAYPLKVTVKDTLTFGEEVEAEVDLVVLSVGMMPSKIKDLVDMMKLPLGADHFLQEVHPKLRPVELANTGILLAGTCQAPMDITEACNAAQASAAKASNLLTKGYVELDPFVARVDMASCQGNGACVGVCPVDAIMMKTIETEGQPVERSDVNPALCTGCGICVAVCPENAIDIRGWTLKQYEDMVDAIAAA